MAKKKKSPIGKNKSLSIKLKRLTKAEIEKAIRGSVCNKISPKRPELRPPPPPPPLPMANFQSFQLNIPNYLKPKKKFDAVVQMKKANWTEISPRKILKNSFWVKCQEDKLASEDILAGLAANFKRKEEGLVVKTLIKKKNIGLRVINQKSAFGISILLGSSLKHVSYEHFKRCILRCDTTVLNSDIIYQLNKYLPPPDQLKLLQGIKKSGDELSDAEKFVATIGEVDQLVPRLNSIDLKLRFAEIAQDIEYDIAAGTSACNEVQQSVKFAKILELILLVGNYMNSGSMKNPAFGFEMPFLTKLKDTKHLNNKQTLLHYIVDTIEKKFPEVLSFGEELLHVEKAVRVSFEKVQDNMRQITTSLEQLNLALKNLKVPESSDDKFLDVMNGIAIRYNDKAKLLIEASAKMENDYKSVGEYFAFDPELYPMEAFFSDIQSFKTMFLQAHEENLFNSNVLE